MPACLIMLHLYVNACQYEFSGVFSGISGRVRVIRKFVFNDSVQSSEIPHMSVLFL